jgi:ribonuclease HI
MDIYTDGGCSGNPGPGGWAFVALTQAGPHEESGADPATTNNRMELTAVIRALEFVAGRVKAGTPEACVIHTDSQYVKNGITSWILSWKRNGWRTANKDPVKNRELWERLDALASGLSLTWTWVKGHAGIDLNERCDELVGIAMRSIAKGG